MLAPAGAGHPRPSATPKRDQLLVFGVSRRRGLSGRVSRVANVTASAALWRLSQQCAANGRHGSAVRNTSEVLPSLLQQLRRTSGGPGCMSRGDAAAHAQAAASAPDAAKAGIPDCCSSSHGPASEATSPSESPTQNGSGQQTPGANRVLPHSESPALTFEVSCFSHPLT